MRLRVHPRRESAAIPPTQLPDLVERADFCEKVRAARSAFVAHHRRAIKRVLCEVGAQHPCQAQAPVNVGGRPPGRPLANPRTRKSADRNGLTLCESQIPVEKGRNCDFATTVSASREYWRESVLGSNLVRGAFLQSPTVRKALTFAPPAAANLCKCARLKRSNLPHLRKQKPPLNRKDLARV